MLYFYLTDIYKIFTGKKEMDFSSVSSYSILPLDNKVFIIAFVIFIISIMVILYGSATERDGLKKNISTKIRTIIQKITSKWKKENINSIYLAPEIKKLEKPVNSLCQKLGIDYVNILVDENLKQPAVAKSIAPPTVILQKEFVEQFVLEEETGKLMFVIGHELVHIKYKDTPGMKRESIKAFIILSILAICGFKLAFMCLYSGLDIITFFIAFIELAICIIMSTMCDPRYWRQVAELRADRIGLEACGGNTDTFRSVMKQLGEDDKAVSWKEGLLRWYLMLYEDMDEHPHIKTRIYETGRGKKWCWKEYLRYCWLMMCNKLKGRGWRL
ncbi:MAG: M48 family metalloprotease [Lachnospiraceae bacterium]|nr:M48 family metalloprotease [Lachnospiraceae bacterium]